MHIFGHLLFWNPTPKIQEGRQLNMQIRWFFVFVFVFVCLFVCLFVFVFWTPKYPRPKYEAHTISN